jgi:hypothetical protein
MSNIRMILADIRDLRNTFERDASATNHDWNDQQATEYNVLVYEPICNEIRTLESQTSELLQILVRLLDTDSTNH